MIFDYASKLRSRPYFGWLFALTSFVVALALRFVVDPYLSAGFPFLTFFPAVMLSAFLGGTRQGILCASLCTLAAWYWFIPTFDSFELDFQGVVALLFFVGVITIDILIIHLLNEAVEAVSRQQEEALRLADERRTLFQELQHRVANNLSFVSSLLSIHRRRLAHNEEASTALDDARVRLETMSKIHRRLYDPDTRDVTLSDTLRGICTDLVDASGRPGIRCNVDADGVSLPVEKTMTLSLVLIEAVSNSIKHAFDGRSDGQIDVRLVEAAPDQLELVVIDDGPGLPADFDPQHSKRLGHRIMSGFARTLRGDIAYATRNGTVTTLTFPRH